MEEVIYSHRRFGTVKNGECNKVPKIQNRSAFIESEVIMANWGIKNPPKKTGRYLVTLKTNFGNQVRQADRCEYPRGNWYWSILPGGTATSEVIAWQKCPMPYNG